MATSVPSPTFGPRGFIIPTEPAVLAGVQADMNAALGGGVNPSLETPQGQLASSETAVIGDKNAQFLHYTNGVDPAYADGRMQDAIGRIYFIERNPAVATIVTGVCVGLVGTVIPAGSLVSSSDGSLYASTSVATIGAGGTVDNQFACTITGAIACPAGSLTSIYRAVPGWDSVSNPADGVTGRPVENRQEFEDRRAASVAVNARNTLASIRGAVLDVPNVLDAYVTDNSTAAPVTTGGVTLPSYATYVAVIGGVGQDVATAYWTKKPPGGPMVTSGATAYTVQDTSSDYTPPYPSYTIYVTTAALLQIVFSIVFTNSTAVPADATAQVQAAIVAAMAGTDGGQRARIGGTLYATRFIAPVVALGDWAREIVSLSIGSANTALGVGTASIAGTTMTVTAAGTPGFAVGQAVIGANVAAGTFITALGTGSGGTGTYTVGLSQTAASAAVRGVAATSDTVTAQINQYPAVTAANVAVAFV